MHQKCLHFKRELLYQVHKKKMDAQKHGMPDIHCSPDLLRISERKSSCASLCYLFAKSLIGCPVRMEKLKLFYTHSSVWEVHAFNFSVLAVLAAFVWLLILSVLQPNCCKLWFFSLLSVNRERSVKEQPWGKSRGMTFPWLSHCMGSSSSNVSHSAGI